MKRSHLRPRPRTGRSPTPAAAVHGRTADRAQGSGGPPYVSGGPPASPRVDPTKLAHAALFVDGRRRIESSILSVVASSVNGCAYECAHRVVSEGCRSPQYVAASNRANSSSFRSGSTCFSSFGGTFNPVQAAVSSLLRPHLHGRRRLAERPSRRAVNQDARLLLGLSILAVPRPTRERPRSKAGSVVLTHSARSLRLS